MQIFKEKLTFGCNSSILVETLLAVDGLLLLLVLFLSTDVSLLYFIENSSFILEDDAPGIGNIWI